MTQDEILRQVGDPQLWGLVSLGSKADSSGVFDMTFVVGSQYPIDAGTVDWGYDLRDGSRRLTIVKFVDHRATVVACARLREGKTR